MTVSVIIPNLNGKVHLAECLDALQAQTFTDFEIIFVDNGSTDGSIEFVAKHYPNIHRVAHATNTGFAGGVNSGIKVASGKYIALLNNDAIAHPSWLTELVKAMDVADIAGAKMLYYSDHHEIDTTGDFISKWGLAYPRGRNQTDSDKYSGYPAIFSACGGACIIKRSVLDEVGLFDEDFFAYYEDTDMGFRARLAGYKVVLAPKAEVYHHVGATTSKMGHFARYQSLKNTQYLFWKNMPSPLLWKVLPRFIFVETLLLGAAIKNGAFTVAVTANWEVFTHIPATWRKRRRIQKAKRISSHDIEALLTDHWPLNSRVGRSPAKRV